MDKLYTEGICILRYFLESHKIVPKIEFKNLKGFHVKHFIYIFMGTALSAHFFLKK